MPLKGNRLQDSTSKYLEVEANKHIFHAFLLNIRNYSPEVNNIQQHGAELNIILPRVNNFNIKQKSAWNIYFITYPQHQTKSWVNADKVNLSENTTFFFFLKKVQL